MSQTPSILGPIDYNKLPNAMIIKGTVSQTASAGSDTIQDITKNFPANLLAGSLLVITLPNPSLGMIPTTRYYRIASNTSNTITIQGAVFDVDVPATTPYTIIVLIAGGGGGGGGSTNANITQVSGTVQTADDWTARFKALNDDTVKGLLKSIGDAGTTPTNAPGRTVLGRLLDIYGLINEIGFLSLYASTSIPLAANGTYTSSTESTSYTGRIVGTVFADAAGTLIIEQSPDSTNWDLQDSYSVQANVGLGFSVEKVASYARVRYVNGPTAQTVFRLYIYRRLRVI